MRNSLYFGLMKYLLPLLFLFTTFTSFTQQNHESVYVHDSESFRFTLPDNFQGETSREGIADFYFRNISQEADKDSNSLSDMIMITMSPAENATNTAGLFHAVKERNEEITLEVITGSHKTSSGHTFEKVFGMYDNITGELVPAFAASIQFHELSILIMLIDIDDGVDIAPETFDAFLESYTTYQTDKESTYIPMEELVYTPSTEGMTTFYNANFETELFYTFFSMFPETFDFTNFDGSWEEDWRQDYPELISAYYFEPSSEEQLNSCGVKMFSSGVSSAGNNALSLLSNLQEVIPSHYIETLNKVGLMNGEHFVFTKYNVTSSAYQFADQHVYETSILGESVVLLLYFDIPPTEGFQKQIETILRSLSYEPY